MRKKLLRGYIICQLLFLGHEIWEGLFSYLLDLLKCNCIIKVRGKSFTFKNSFAIFLVMHSRVSLLTS